uniref:Uncharacterized protein n=1 Tax=Opuntia streptacantha TaxID=393608 RepID=A0A7C9AK31_OPUST
MPILFDGMAKPCCTNFHTFRAMGSIQIENQISSASRADEFIRDNLSPSLETSSCQPFNELFRQWLSVCMVGNFSLSCPLEPSIAQCHCKTRINKLMFTIETKLQSL